MTRRVEASDDINGEISFTDLGTTLWNSRVLITIFAAIGLFASSLYVIVVPAQYEATIRIRMAQYRIGDTFGVNPNNNRIGKINYDNIESTGELIQRLRFSTAYSADALRECDAASSEGISPYLDGRVKATFVKDIADAVEIKLRISNPAVALSCATALFEMIRSQQQDRFKDALYSMQEQLTKTHESIKKIEEQLSRLGRSDVAAHITHISSYLELSALKNNISRLNDELQFVEQHPTSLLTPISVSDKPVAPNVLRILLLCSLAGLVFGVIITLLRKLYRIPSVHS